MSQPRPAADRPAAARPVRLRVLVVAETFEPGSGSVPRVLAHLAAQGNEAQLVTYTGPTTYAGFPVRRTHGWPAGPRLRATLRRFGPDVVHVAGLGRLGRRAVLVASGLGVPVVLDVGPTGPTGEGGPPSRVLARADRVLAGSTAALRDVQALGVERLALWPCGVDLTAFHPSRRSDSWRRSLAPDGRRLVGHVGPLERVEEVDLLTGLDHDERYRLVLVGSGPDEARLRRLLPHAHFLGDLRGEALAAAYASLDVLVHTARRETCGRLVRAGLEALASGVPVVAPRNGVAEDLVDEGSAGLLFEPGDAADLKACVARLLHDDLALRRTALAARRSVRHRSWRVLDEALVEHYRAVVTTSSASSTVSTRCTCGSMARPEASACSNGQAGRSTVQCSRPTSTIGATDASSA